MIHLRQISSRLNKAMLVVLSISFIALPCLGFAIDNASKAQNPTSLNNKSTHLGARASTDSHENHTATYLRLHKIIQSQKVMLAELEQKMEAMQKKLQQLRAQTVAGYHYTDKQLHAELTKQYDSLQYMQGRVKSLQAQTNQLIEYKVPSMLEHFKLHIARKWNIFIQHTAIPLDHCSDVRKNTQNASVKELLSEGANLRSLCEQASIPGHHTKGACYWQGQTKNSGDCQRVK